MLAFFHFFSGFCIQLAWFYKVSFVSCQVLLTFSQALKVRNPSVKIKLNLYTLLKNGICPHRRDNFFKEFNFFR